MILFAMLLRMEALDVVQETVEDHLFNMMVIMQHCLSMGYCNECNDTYPNANGRVTNVLEWILENAPEAAYDAQCQDQDEP
jgi:hypothetical protein